MIFLSEIHFGAAGMPSLNRKRPLIEFDSDSINLSTHGAPPDRWCLHDSAYFLARASLCKKTLVYSLRILLHLGLYTKIRLGICRGLGSMFTINISFRKARKLHRIILLRIGLVTFNFHFSKIQKVFMFMIFGPSGHDHDQLREFSPPHPSPFRFPPCISPTPRFGQLFWHVLPFICVGLRDRCWK